jgi:hypothetical protein
MKSTLASKYFQEDLSCIDLDLSHIVFSFGFEKNQKEE